MSASWAFAAKSAAARDENEVTSKPGGSPIELMSWPVLSISITLRALALRINVWRIALIDQKASSQRAQFPLTIGPRPPGPLGLAAQYGRPWRYARQGCPTLPPRQAGVETEPSPHPVDNPRDGGAALRSRNWPKTNHAAVDGQGEKRPKGTP